MDYYHINNKDYENDTDDNSQGDKSQCSHIIELHPSKNRNDPMQEVREQEDSNTSTQSQHSTVLTLRHNNRQLGNQHPSMSDSSLQKMAHILSSRLTYNLANNLAWQWNTRGTTTNVKMFHNEVTQELGLVVFAFMRPNRGGSTTHPLQCNIHSLGRGFTFAQ